MAFLLRITKLSIKPQKFGIIRRNFRTALTGTEECSQPVSRGLVLGVYADENNHDDDGMLTPSALRYNEVVLLSGKFFSSI